MEKLINEFKKLNEKYIDFKHEEAIIQDSFYKMFQSPNNLYRTYLKYLNYEYRVHYICFDDLVIYLELNNSEDDIVITVDFNEFKNIWLDNGLKIKENEK